MLRKLSKQILSVFLCVVTLLLLAGCKGNSKPVIKSTLEKLPGHTVKVTRWALIEEKKDGKGELKDGNFAYQGSWKNKLLDGTGKLTVYKKAEDSKKAVKSTEYDGTFKNGFFVQGTIKTFDAANHDKVKSEAKVVNSKLHGVTKKYLKVKDKDVCEENVFKAGRLVSRKAYYLADKKVCWEGKTNGHTLTLNNAVNHTKLFENYNPKAFRVVYHAALKEAKVNSRALPSNVYQEFYRNGSRRMVAAPNQKKGAIFYQNSKQAKVEIVNAATVKEYDAKGKLIKTRTVQELTDQDEEIKKLLDRVNGK